MAVEKDRCPEKHQRWLIAIAITAEVDAPPDIWSGETLLKEELKQHGCDVIQVPWYDSDAVWSSYDLVIANRVYDYPQKSDQFLAWLNDLEQLGVRTINSINILRWNTNKSYLVELLRSGAPVIDTVLLRDSKDTPHLSTVMQEKGWKEVILKPAISNRSMKILRTSQADDKAQRHIEQLVQENGGALVQPFLPAIETEGEWSLVFFSGVFSHAVRALPHGELGRLECKISDLVIVEPPEDVLCAANAVMSTIPWKEPPGFARVDLLRGHGDEGYKLVELEMIEPVLYLGLCREAAQPFARAVLAAFS